MTRGSWWDQDNKVRYKEGSAHTRLLLKKDMN
jgi:hypothetical protein